MSNLSPEKKLSDRLRPGVECAPWVIEAVIKLERQLSAYKNRGPEIRCANIGAGVETTDAMQEIFEHRLSKLKQSVETSKALTQDEVSMLCNGLAAIRGRYKNYAVGSEQFQNDYAEEGREFDAADSPEYWNGLVADIEALDTKIRALVQQPVPPTCPECSQFNVRYSVVMADLQKLASKISGGDCSHTHGLDCTTVIAHHWDKRVASPPTGWQPIETAPQEGEFLVWMPKPHLGRHVHSARYHPNIKEVGGCFIFDLESKPTHWMPLPHEPVDDLAKFASDLAARQKDMPSDFAKVLNDNFSELLSREPGDSNGN